MSSDKCTELRERQGTVMGRWENQIWGSQVCNGQGGCWDKWAVMPSTPPLMPCLSRSLCLYLLQNPSDWGQVLYSILNQGGVEGGTSTTEIQGETRQNKNSEEKNKSRQREIKVPPKNVSHMIGFRGKNCIFSLLQTLFLPVMLY